MIRRLVLIGGCQHPSPTPFSFQNDDDPLDTKVTLSAFNLDHEVSVVGWVHAGKVWKEIEVKDSKK